MGGVIISQNHKAPKRFLELDALRGLAAMFVVMYHFTQGKIATDIFKLGVTGVDLFFLISGFVIFMSISKVKSGTEFVINRVARLYPTYWACVTISFGVMVLLRAIHFNAVHDSNAGWIDYLANLTMFQYYLGIKDIDVPYWTMIIEMLFYLFVLLLYLLKSLKHIIIIGCVFNVLILLNYFAVTNGWLNNYTAAFPLINHFALFFGGIVFYKLVTYSIKPVAGYTLIVFCYFTQLVIFKFAGTASDHISFMKYWAMLSLYFMLFILFINRSLTFIAVRPALFLGNISFALYLSHSYIFRGVIGFAEKRFGLPFWIATLGIAVPLAIFVAYLITILIERPLGRWLKVFLQRLVISTS